MSWFNLFGTAHAVAEVAELNRRKNELLGHFRAMIEREGGSIDSVKSLNSRLIVRSPFPSKLIRANVIGGRPVLLEMRCRYPNDSGAWYVCASAGGAQQWAWMSDNKKTELPVHRNGGRVKNNVLTFPFWVGALLYLALIALVLVPIFYFLGKRR